MDQTGHISFKLGTDIPAEQAMMNFAPSGVPLMPPPPPASKIGSLEYANRVVTEISVPEGASPQFNVQYHKQQSVPGVYLNSHRSISAYQPIAWIPARFSPVSEIFESFINEVRSRFLGHGSQKSSMLLMKESLLAAAIYSEGNSSVIPDDEARIVWEGFQDVLRFLLPPQLGFMRLVATPPEVLLRTSTGDFTVDALSGGLRAVFELAWQIFLRSHTMNDFTVCIDEPENHLHPALQRSLMPNLMKAFPKVKFLVATHSPFVVTSAADANIYALQYADNNRVSANLLDPTKSGLSAEEILREVLGLESTMPLWAENRFNKILMEFASSTPNSESIERLRQALASAGLESEMPTAVKAIVDQDPDR